MGITALFRTLFLSVCAVGLMACESTHDDDEDMIWDFYPFVLHLTVQNTKGDDLLNPQTVGSIAERDIKALYRGATYEKDAVVDKSRAYMPHFQGLQTGQSSDGRYYLTFGEFGGDASFDNEQVTLDWGDGTTDVITFSNQLTWESKNKPIIVRQFFLNGQGTGNNYGNFKIIK